MEQVVAELSVSLVSIKIPDGVTYIGKSAFSDCENLETIYIPGNVEMIDAGAFSWCKQLSAMYIARKATQINQYALSNLDLPNVTTIYAPKGSNAIKFAKKYKIPFVVEE